MAAFLKIFNVTACGRKKKEEIEKTALSEDASQIWPWPCLNEHNFDLHFFMSVVKLLHQTQRLCHLPRFATTYARAAAKEELAKRRKEEIIMLFSLSFVRDTCYTAREENRRHYSLPSGK